MKIKHLDSGRLFRFARSCTTEICEVVDPDDSTYRIVGDYITGSPHPLPQRGLVSDDRLFRDVKPLDSQHVAMFQFALYDKAVRA